MASTTLTADIIAKEAIALLDNNLVMAKNVYRGYEEDYATRVNGYQIGDTLSIRKPTDFTVRTGITAAVQDTIEGKVVLTCNNIAGFDFRFTSTDLTLKIDDLSERILQPGMIQIANKIDQDLAGLYAKVPQWVGTAGQTINSFTDYMLGPQQLDQFAVPSDGRTSILSPPDYYGMAGAATALLNNNIVGDNYRNGNVGMIANVDTNMSQNVSTFTTGSRTGATTSIGASITTSTITYDTAKNLNGGLTQQTISVANLGGATLTVAAGDVFTISTVFAVNPVTKAKLPFLKQFCVVTAATASGAAITNLVIQPAIIWTGAFQNITTTNTDLNSLVITWVGSASTAYPQNMVFQKNAFALVTVPMVKPPGSVDCSRRSYKGINVRVIPGYDWTNDISAWRVDVLYAFGVLDPRLATRLSGT